MYANLIVTTGKGEVLCAHEVTLGSEYAHVRLEDPRAEGHEPIGTRTFRVGVDLEDMPLTIQANF